MSNITPAFCKAFAEVQAKLPSVPKSSTNPHFKSKFASLDSFNDKVLPVLNEHGFSIVQSMETRDGLTKTFTDDKGSEHYQGAYAVIVTYLMHETGYIKSEYLIGWDGNPQKQGAAVTYGRRYAAFAILGIVGDEDDDGNAAAGIKTSDDAPTASLRSKPSGLRSYSKVY